MNEIGFGWGLGVYITIANVSHPNPKASHNFMSNHIPSPNFKPR